jgi:phosphoglucosamine mutase
MRLPPLGRVGQPVAERLFGTDGIRGPAGLGALSPRSLTRLGLAIARTLTSGSKARAKRRILVGRDTRVSGPAVSAAVSAGLLAGGVDVDDGGVLPTPAVALLVRQDRFDLGVVVSASHNAWQDNGVKLLGRDGRKLSDEAEATIERAYADPATEDYARPDDFGRAAPRSAADSEYARALLAGWRRTRLTGLELVIDCANGAQSGIAAAVLKRLGAKVTAIHCEPNGRNINAKCGAMHPDVVGRAVRAAKAHAGVAFDGDADRVLLTDEKGRVIDGDAIVAALAPRLRAEGRLPHDTVVGTSMSNGGLAAHLAPHGIRVLRTAVGDRHIVAEMAARGYGLGAEPSGHVIVPRDGLLTGDGLWAAIACLRIVVKERIPASQLAGGYKAWPLDIVSIPVKERRPIEEMKATSAAVAAAEERLGENGRIVVRYSGTEPKVRVMVEARRRADVQAALGPVLAALREEAGR